MQGCKGTLRDTFRTLRVCKGTLQETFRTQRGCKETLRETFSALRGCKGTHRETFRTLRGCKGMLQETFRTLQGCKGTLQFIDKSIYKTNRILWSNNISSKHSILICWRLFPCINFILHIYEIYSILQKLFEVFSQSDVPRLGDMAKY